MKRLIFDRKINIISVIFVGLLDVINDRLIGHRDHCMRIY